MMNKKKEKLAMIDELLKNSIEPQIKKIRKEREEYQAWKSGENRLKEMQSRIKWHEWLTKDRRKATLEVEVQL
jgi:chromosome segregation ATPase